MTEKRPEWFNDFLGRLDELRKLIPEEIYEESNQRPVDEASMKDAQVFASSLIGLSRPGVFVTLDGKTRFVWQDDGIPGVCQFSEQVTFKFMSNGRVQYVFFKREKDLTDSYHCGITNSNLILVLINTLDLDHIIHPST